MSISQLSVFVENKTGTLVEITEALANEGIDLRAMSIADTQDFGILRLIVSDPDKAEQTLKKTNCIVTRNEVIGASLHDEPGALARVLKLLSDNGVNVEYMYAFNGASAHHAYVVLRVNDNDKVAKLLTENRIRLISQQQISEI